MIWLKNLRKVRYRTFQLRPLRDLGYAPQVDLQGMVARVLGAHEEQNLKTAQAFKKMKAFCLEESGKLTRAAIEIHVREHLVRGREDYSGGSGSTGISNVMLVGSIGVGRLLETSQEQSQVDEFVDRLMEQLDPDGNGIVEWADFSDWNRKSTMDGELWKQAASVEDDLRRQLRELGQVPRV